MGKLKYQILAILIAILIGVTVGGLLTSNKKDKELKKLVEQHKVQLQNNIVLSQKKIESLDSLLKEKEKKSLNDSLLVVGLQKQIISNNKKIEQLRTEAAKMTTNEKIDWVINRYSSNN